jgi:hypothetical protein
MKPLKPRQPTEAPRSGTKDPIHVGTIRADHYAAALRDPKVRARLDRVMARTKPQSRPS